MIYFDNAATTYPKPESVYEFMDKFYRNCGVNAGRGSYQAAGKAVDLIEGTRNKVLNIFGVNDSKEVIFTASATEAINLVLQGLDWKEGDIVYYSPFEHNAVLRTLYYLEEEKNIKLKEISVNDNTLEFQLSDLKQMFISEPPRLVAVSQVSNVCGVIAPVEELAKLTVEYGGEILVDGAQGAGIVEVDLKNVDYYIWAGHKSLYGPFGIAGVLVESDSLALNPFLYGGTGKASERRRMSQQVPTKYEAGSKNIQAIAGLNAALDWLEEVGTEEVYKHDKQLTEELIEVLEDFLDIKLFLPHNLENHFNVVAVDIANYLPHDIGRRLDEEFNVAVRTGLHCAPKAHELLGTMPEGLVRFSIGYFNTEEEIKELREALDSFLI